MLEVTAAAKEQLKQIIQTRDLSPSQCLRLTVPPVWTGEGNFGIVIDAPGVEDHVVDFDGIGVLRIDTNVIDGLVNAILDYRSSPEGGRMTLDIY